LRAFTFLDQVKHAFVTAVFCSTLVTISFTTFLKVFFGVYSDSASKTDCVSVFLVVRLIFCTRHCSVGKALGLESAESDAG